MVFVTLGSITFSLREKFDFSFLSLYGEPFAVFDDQDSGNLCFGVRGGEGRRWFVKLAGAPTRRANVAPEEAVKRLQATIAVYEDLRHPALLPVLHEGPVPGGHILVSPWFDGDCMGRQYPSHRKFAALPLEEKLAIYDVILDFHSHVQERGYVAIDFYDGSVMVDFAAGETRICDIEFYRRAPVVNDMGRMWGSSRFMSPEEFTLGAVIDGRSNVFCMGAMAFQLFGGGADRSQRLWQAPPALYRVAATAICPHREGRYGSVEALRQTWNAARAFSSGL